MASENYNSLSKQEAIEQLRQTIKQLETITEQLEDTSVIDLPSSASIQNLIATTIELEKIIAQKSALQSDRTGDTSKDVETQSPANTTTISEEKVPEQINTVTSEKATSEPKVRIFEPAPTIAKEKESAPKVQQPVVKTQLQANKNKRTLIGIAAALLLIIVPLSWKLFLTNDSQLIAEYPQDNIIQSAPEPIVITPPIEETEPLVNDKIPSLDVPAIAENTPDNTIQPIVIAPPIAETEPLVNDKIPSLDVPVIAQNSPDNTIQPAPEPILTTPPIEETEPLVNDEIAQKSILPPEKIAEPKTNLNTEIPSNLVANQPRKLARETIDPNIELTPEQNLIAALESKANNLASRYDDDLVVSIKPDFIDSTVVVTVADRWYELLAPRQDKIVEEMLKRSRSFEFDKLKITDSQNNLIARSPVIGEDMIILRRTT